MIKFRKYKYSEGKDPKDIWDRLFFEKLSELEKEKKIAEPYFARRAHQHYVLHVHPGLTATIQEDTIPVFAYGEASSFERGISVLEELLNCKLEEIKE